FSEVASCGLLPGPAHEFFSEVASCGLLPGPAHEFFSEVASCGLLPRTTRPGPRLRTAYPAVAILPLRDTRESWTWSAPLTECSVILSEASLRAKSKDPHLVASSAWVADPSQASVILSEASLRAKSKDPHLVASSAWVADPSQAQDDSQPVEDPKRTGRCAKLARVHARWTGDQVQDSRVSRSGRIATDQKAVRRRGPGRVVLGS